MQLQIGYPYAGRVGSGWSQGHDCKKSLGPWWPNLHEAGQHQRECVPPPVEPRNLVAELKAPEPEEPVAPAPSVPGFACGPLVLPINILGIQIITTSPAPSWPSATSNW